MSSFTALMQLAAQRTDASNAAVNTQLAARQRAEAEKRKAQEERERKERENEARLRLKRLDDEKREKDRQRQREEAERARERERERREAEARAVLLGKKRSAGSNWGRSPGGEGSSRGVKRQRSTSPDPNSQLTREEKRARKEAIALARESGSSSYRRPTARSSHSSGRRLAGGAVDAVEGESGGADGRPLGWSPIAPGTGTAKARLAAMQPALIKLNTVKRDMRSIDEIQRDRATRKALVGEEARGFSDWFGKDKAKKDKEEADAKRAAAFAKQRDALAGKSPSKSASPAPPPAKTIAKPVAAKPSPAPAPSRVSGFASSSRPTASSSKPAARPTTSKPTAKPAVSAKPKKRVYNEDNLDVSDDDDDPRQRTKGKSATGYDRSEIWRIVAGKDRRAYEREDDYDSDDMEAGADELLEEELRSARAAKKEDALAYAEERRREEEKKRRKMAAGRT
ncbi:SPT2-domain-containing protein [Exidia glandulosa HHB12029]|uniref:SPT2-domain-containing protein n=1 Tax=Exidia glandulosa HHB12029 TaxID=1314781 RepID=A0A165KNZ1_EXIGL|nr:SPT2-domain-containing protein [Exidia glandulosa HHB12029]